MNYKETQCDDLVRYIVKSIGRCIFCGSFKDLEAHHIFGGCDKSNYILRYTTELCLCLCWSCHHQQPWKPHSNPQGSKPFFAKLEDYLIRTSQPERLNLIKHFKIPKNRNIEQPEIEIIHQGLKIKAEKIKNEEWMDCRDETYQGRDSENEPIFT